MKSRPILTAACLLAFFPFASGARTFTNTAGKQIEAELIAVEDGKAVLKLGANRKAKVPLSSLSEADQAYAKSWHEENKNKITERDVTLEIDKDTERLKKEESGKGGGGGKGGKGGGNSSKSETTATTFNCTLENSSSKTIEGITAAYTVYKRISIRGEGGSDTMTSETTDTINLDTLKSRDSVKFSTDPVECHDFTKSSKKGPTESQREKVIGVVITLSVGGNEFLKQSEPDNLLDRMEEEKKRQEAREKESEKRR